MTKRMARFAGLAFMLSFAGCNSSERSEISLVRFGVSDLMTYNPVSDVSATALLEGILEDRAGCIVVASTDGDVAIVIPRSWVTTSPARLVPPDHDEIMLGQKVRFGGGEEDMSAPEGRGACEGLPSFAVGSLAAEQQGN